MQGTIDAAWEKSTLRHRRLVQIDDIQHIVIAATKSQSIGIHLHDVRNGRVDTGDTLIIIEAIIE